MNRKLGRGNDHSLANTLIAMTTAPDARLIWLAFARRRRYEWGHTDAMQMFDAAITRREEYLAALD